MNQKDASNVLRITKKAKTPFWLSKRMYEKIDAEIEPTLDPIDSTVLERNYNDFN